MMACAECGSTEGFILVSTQHHPDCLRCKECGEGETKEKGMVISYTGGYHSGCLRCEVCDECETPEKGKVYPQYHINMHQKCYTPPMPCSCCS